jgi:hypothetical protein
MKQMTGDISFTWLMTKSCRKFKTFVVIELKAATFSASILLSPFNIAVPSRRKQVLDKIIIEILCDSSETETSYDDRVNDKYYATFESVLCEESNHDRCKETSFVSNSKHTWS